MKYSLTIIGGYGAMGVWALNFFHENKLLGTLFDVTITGPNDTKGTKIAKEFNVKYEKDNIKASKDTDITIISVPIEFTEKSIEEVGPHLKPGSLLIDLTSVKTPVVDALNKFVKKEQDQIIHGEKRRQTRVEAVRSEIKFDPKAPKGLDIFEMLLPVLMPPIATEFSDELFFPAELFPFQRAGVKWLFENSSALLADDMGLGKTVQAITAFRALLRRSQALQALVICPLSVLTNWTRELEKWAPELVAVRVYGNQTTRRIQ